MVRSTNWMLQWRFSKNDWVGAVGLHTVSVIEAVIGGVLKITNPVMGIGIWGEKWRSLEMRYWHHLHEDDFLVLVTEVSVTRKHSLKCWWLMEGNELQSNKWQSYLPDYFISPCENQMRYGLGKHNKPVFFF